MVGRSVGGKFAVEQFIGKGSMGAVYRARHTALDKVVALKILHGELAEKPTFPERFMREAKAASRIEHPNSMRVVDFGEEPDGTLYMAMEYLDGRDLSRVVKQDGPLSPPRIADLLMQALAALAVAHEMGIVHRDLKPENIMVLGVADDEGHRRDLVKVCDFGIAKITDPRSDPTRGDASPLTSYGLVMGTPEYMSPEQGIGDPLDARADIYSMGVILYQLLTGKLPFEAESAIGVLLKHTTEEPVRPSTRAEAVDPELEAICLRAMRKPPSERYQSAREMRSDLRRVSDRGGAPTASRPETPGRLAPVAKEVAQDPTGHATLLEHATSTEEIANESVQLPMHQQRTGWILGVALLLAAVAFGGFFIREGFPSAPPPAASSGTSDPSSRSAPSASARKSLSPTASASGSLPARKEHPGKPSLGPQKPSATPSGSAPPPSAPSDVGHAKVSVGSVQSTGTTEAAVRQEIDLEQLTECYRAALELSPAKPPAAKMVLHLTADNAGRVRSATLRGAAGFPPRAAECVIQASLQKNIGATEDTGGATADVNLVFSPD